MKRDPLLSAIHIAFNYYTDAFELYLYFNRRLSNANRPTCPEDCPRSRIVEPAKIK